MRREAVPKSTWSALERRPRLRKTSGIKPGLAAGDIIQQIDNQPITDAASLTAHLTNKTRPEQEVIVHIQRPSTKQSIQFKVQLARRPLEVVAPESHSFKGKEVDPTIAPAFFGLCRWTPAYHQGE